MIFLPHHPTSSFVECSSLFTSGNSFFSSVWSRPLFGVFSPLKLFTFQQFSVWSRSSLHRVVVVVVVCTRLQDNANEGSNVVRHFSLDWIFNRFLSLFGRARHCAAAVPVSRAEALLQVQPVHCSPKKRWPLPPICKKKETEKHWHQIRVMTPSFRHGAGRMLLRMTNFEWSSLSVRKAAAKQQMEFREN